MNPFIETITSQESELRNRSFFEMANKMSADELLASLLELEKFRHQSKNLYEKVRANIFLYAAYRFILIHNNKLEQTGHILPEGYENLLKRHFEKAIQIFNNEIEQHGHNQNIYSCLAESYQHLTFQILADQVRRSVRSSIGNQWMFRVGHADDHPLKIHSALLRRENANSLFPLLIEKTSVRMDLTHSAWSDIFFLGMDYPEGARVINVSLNLGVYGRDVDIKAPLESYLRIIPEPVIRLTSLDLNDSKDISTLADLFNFGNDYLSLLKAALIASGFIPPSFEGTHHQLSHILASLIEPGMGIELVTKVNDIPKGSRLAVSTNLLASMISALMRATGQTEKLEGQLNERERRLVASRAILGEWLGGSGGGWQDSGGIWPGIKAIEGALAGAIDPENGISRGCLLPQHKILSSNELHPQIENKIAESLVLFHGGMASNVGPILEMVTEKYLLRSEKEWQARQTTNEIYNQILIALQSGDIKKLAQCTNNNWEGPIKTIIPWATTAFTETIIKKAKNALGDKYFGFLMLGGMSGGGMGIFVDPSIHSKAKDIILKILLETQEEMKHELPFAMKPVVYNFSINNEGTLSSLLKNEKALMPSAYYAHHVTRLVREPAENIQELRKAEIDLYTRNCANNSEAYILLRNVVSNLFRHRADTDNTLMRAENQKAEEIRITNHFDSIQHEQTRNDLRKGRIGLSRNRLPAETAIEDITKNEIISIDLNKDSPIGEKAIQSGELATLCLAAGVGSRWTNGAGVIKALNPFVIMNGKHVSFTDIHLSKNKKTAAKYQCNVPIVFATSYLTHEPLTKYLSQIKKDDYPGTIYLSSGRSLGQRFIPMERDLRFLWEEMTQEILDENKQKVRESSRAALIDWARNINEGSDYTNNIAMQRFSPLGHWYELPNMILNGILAKLLNENPAVKYLLLHNIDTLGANINAQALEQHIKSGNCLTFEVIPRHIDDRGGGLAKVNGRLRILEGLSQPHDENELGLSYYNTMTTWVSIDALLEYFGLKREQLNHYSQEELSEAIRKIARRVPSYVTIKEVKYRWGHGQEDIYPVAQIEKLWADMSALSDISSGFIAVPRYRGQQLKDPAQLDAWVNDGTKEFIEANCF